MYPLSTLAFGSQFLNEFMNSLVSKSESITIPVCSVVKLVNKNFGSSWNLEKRVLLWNLTPKMSAVERAFEEEFSNKACTLLAFLLLNYAATDAIKVRDTEVKFGISLTWKMRGVNHYKLENWLESWWWSAFVRLWHTKNYRISCLLNKQLFRIFCNSAFGLSLKSKTNNEKWREIWISHFSIRFRIFRWVYEDLSFDWLIDYVYIIPIMPYFNQLWYFKQLLLQ